MIYKKNLDYQIQKRYNNKQKETYILFYDIYVYKIFQ